MFDDIPITRGTFAWLYENCIIHSAIKQYTSGIQNKYNIQTSYKENQWNIF